MQVWFKLIKGGEAEDSADKVQLAEEADVADFREAVKAKRPNSLKNVDAADLVIYRDLDSLENRQKLDEEDKVSGIGKTKAEALLVVVPYEDSPPSSPAESTPLRPSFLHRKRRWEKLNDVLDKHKSFKKGRSSVPYSHIKWDEVRSVFGNMEPYKLVHKPIPEETLNLLVGYLNLCAQSFDGILEGGEAKRSHFIAPIIVCVCSLFKDKIKILLEMDMSGNRVKAHGHFEFVLQCGNVRICIVEAKKDDIPKGMAQNLIGCEVASDLDGLEVVYGIITDYVRWSFVKSCDDKIMSTEISLQEKDGYPNKNSLDLITGQIYSMLSE